MGLTAASSAPVPMTILGGYLGSGKTTRINELLAAGVPLPSSGAGVATRDSAQPGVAVLVNDFGSVNVDAELLRQASGDVVQLENGCICCGVTDAMPTMLRRLREMAPSHLVMELSGVGLPSAARSWAGYPGFRLHSVVVCVDVTTIAERLADRWVADVARDQLRGADELLLTRTDLASPDQVAAVVDLLARVAPGIPVTRRTLAEVLGTDPSPPSTAPSLGEVAAGAPSPGEVAAGAPSLGEVAAGVPSLGEVAAGVPSLGEVAAGVPSLGEVAAGAPSLGEVRAKRASNPTQDRPVAPGAPAHTDHLTRTARWPEPVSLSALQAWLAEAPAGVVRIKGTVAVHGAEGERTVVVQVAGGTVEITDAPAAVEPSGMVAIALGSTDLAAWETWWDGMKR